MEAEKSSDDSSIPYGIRVSSSISIPIALLNSCVWPSELKAHTLLYASGYSAVLDGYVSGEQTLLLSSNW
jgi:hypothetical protein